MERNPTPRHWTRTRTCDSMAARRKSTGDRPSGTFDFRAADIAGPRPAVEIGLTYIHRLRLRVLAWLLGITLAGIAAVSWMAMPAWPVIGVAVAMVVATVSTMTNRLKADTCYSCGNDIRNVQAGEHGRACPQCGAVGFTLASLPDVVDRDEPATDDLNEDRSDA